MSTAISESAEEPIRAASQESCLNCGTAGKLLYSQIRDHLFQSPGEWNLRRCENPHCGMIWLDPMPDPGELHRFYKTYFTHAPTSSGIAKPRRPKSRRHLKVESQRGYLANRFGYHLEECSWWTRLLGWTIWLTPARRMNLEFSVMHLPAVPDGRAVDVGCGAGQILANLQRFGWNVEGVDFDPQAVAAARNRGVTVRLGNLVDQGYPEESFDAVIMSHLIEHVPDPVSLIRECHRILRPGGRMVMLTPNTHSLSHRLFGRAWRGLEPPRHLCIHSRNSLASLTRDGGFHNVKLATSARYAADMFRQAFEIRRLQSGKTPIPFWGQKWLCWFLEAIEIGLLTFGARTIGEEHVCVATKSLREASLPVCTRNVVSRDSTSLPVAAIRPVNLPTVSVAMCTYNGSRFLGEQLQSIQNQTRLPDQLVVCDDGSTDSTRAILKEFARSASFPVTLQFNTRTLGVTRNFEQAIAACPTDFIALCDQDDRWHPSKLECLSAMLCSHPQAGFACSNAALINHRGERLRGRLWDRWRINPSMLAVESPEERGLHLLRANCVTGATMMVRGELVRTYSMPIPPSWVHDHWITVLCEILMCPGCTSAELLTEYRQHDRQILGLKYPGRFNKRARAAERDRLEASNLQRYRDLQFHLKCGVLREIPAAAKWADLIHIATEELLEHHRLQRLPWWQRALNRRLKQIRRAA